MGGLYNPYDSPSMRASDAMEMERMRYEMRHEMERMQRSMIREMRYSMNVPYAVQQVAPPVSAPEPKKKDDKLQKIISYYYTRR